MNNKSKKTQKENNKKTKGQDNKKAKVNNKKKENKVVAKTRKA
jgi:hypothetical protein